MTSFTRRTFGPVFHELGWAPSPAYILRRLFVLRLLGAFEPGSVLEVGCASGAFLLDLKRMGFRPYGLETSAPARELSLKTLRSAQIPVFDSLQPGVLPPFDYLLSFEVLEHVETDREVLAGWVSLLKPGGRAVLSVPAHRRFFGPEDRHWGHYRRYDRSDLESLLRESGLTGVSIYSWGVPFKNLTESLSAAMFKGNLGEGNKSEATALSGISRRHLRLASRLYLSPLGGLVFHSLDALQRLFSGTDLGRGYVAVARRA